MLAPFAGLFLALAVRATVVDWQPAQDFALFQLRTGDVGTRHSPLVGPYSRFGWSHPGPALFAALAVPFRALGARPQGLLVGAVLVNAAAVIGALLVARRRGGTSMLLATAVVAAILVRAMGADLLLSPWNPWIVVLPTFTLLLLAWSVARRDWPLLPPAVVVASFLVQTHVALALLVAVVGAATVAIAIAVTSPVRGTGRALARPAIVAGVLLAVLWAPVVVDQVGGTHNASTMARYFATEQPGRPGVATGAAVAAAELRPVGPWVTGPEEPEPFTGEVPHTATAWLLVPAAALAAGMLVAARRRDRDALALVILATVASAAALVSITRITGQVWPYLVRSTWAVAAFAWLAVGRALVPAVAAAARRWPARAPGASVIADDDTAATRRGANDRPLGIAAAATAALVLVLVVTMAPLGAPPPDPDQSADLASVVRAVRAGTPADAGIVVVRPADTDVLFPAPDSRGLAAGVIADLRLHGVDARAAAEDWRFEGQPGDAGAQLFGDWRLDDGGPIAGTVTIVGARKIDSFVPEAGSVELYRVDDPDEQREVHRLEDELARDFRDAGHPEAVPLIAEDGVRWVGFNIPELGRFGATVDRLVTLRSHRREVVYWHPRR